MLQQVLALELFIIRIGNDGDLGAGTCIVQVIGVGGGGSNAVKRMMESEIEGVEFWSLNTDVQVRTKR